MNKQRALTMPERLLAPCTNKGKEVSLESSGSKTGTEDQDREKNPGQMGTGSVTGANGMLSTVCGHPKVGNRSRVTTVWARKWSAQSEESRFQNGNSGISQERGHSPRRRARWR